MLITTNYYNKSYKLDTTIIHTKMTNNDYIKHFFKKFHNDDTKKVWKGSLIMAPNAFHNKGIKIVLKGSTMMVLKSLKRFLNDVI